MHLGAGGGIYRIGISKQQMQRLSACLRIFEDACTALQDEQGIHFHICIYIYLKTYICYTDDDFFRNRVLDEIPSRDNVSCGIEKLCLSNFQAQNPLLYCGKLGEFYVLLLFRTQTHKLCKGVYAFNHVCVSEN